VWLHDSVHKVIETKLNTKGIINIKLKKGSAATVNRKYNIYNKSNNEGFFR